jgi:hypothetical protein
LLEKVAVLGFSIIMNHPFVDENKRTGHAAIETFLVLNGTEINASVDEQENVVLAITAGEMGREAFIEWLQREFFTEPGFAIEGRAPVEGEWADGVTGLWDMRVEIAMMRTPDSHSRLELSRFLSPPVVGDHRSAPVNALGYRRVRFTVEEYSSMKTKFIGELNKS